jgi:ubiquinone/menaquinone biosynthesis C-methylase UbiE
MFVNPEKNIAALLLQEGMRVADFGAGSGFLTKILSRRVGHTGHVYAIEIQKELVKKLESEIKDNKKEQGQSNVSVIWGDIEKIGGSKIADHALDAVIISNVMFQTEDMLGVIDETKRILKPGGQVLCIDRHVISPKKIEQLFTQRGFAFVENVEETSHQYGIIFRYPDNFSRSFPFILCVCRFDILWTY